MVSEEPSPGEEFLRRLDPDPARALAKYRELFAKLVAFFRWRHCREPEDLTQETLRRVLTQIAREKDITVEISHYAFGVARMVYLEAVRANVRRTESLEDAPEPPTTTIPAVENDILLRQCLEKLSADDRALVRQYYTGDRKQLAEAMNLTAGALRVKVHRILKDVQKR